MKKYIILSIMLSLFISTVSCTKKQSKYPYLSITDVTNTIDTLIKKYGATDSMRIRKGVEQVAMLWYSDDGSKDDFKEFCKNSFIPSGEELDQAFEKLNFYFESLYGNSLQLLLDLRKNIDEDTGPLHFLDEMFGSYDPMAHITDDFFKNKIAFVIRLNFPYYTLAEKNKEGINWTARQWGYARLGDMFTSRIPADKQQNLTQTLSKAETYIATYNIYMGNIIDEKGNKMFDTSDVLISHWGLRDKLKTYYANKDGLKYQKTIYEVMKHIIDQTIPKEVINSDAYQWDPQNNILYSNGEKINATAENNQRYQVWLNNFHAIKEMDPYYPEYKNYIELSFDGVMELSFDEVEKLFITFISSPLLKDIGDVIENRLGRPLEAFDIWYDGFKPRATIDEAKLNAITKERFKSPEDFEKQMADMLISLGFPKDTAEYIANYIEVDPARGSGHAWGAESRNMKSHLRTRIAKDGMNYLGFNIASHEFGHNVEQTISLHFVDNYFIHGVPNTAFTEACAFLFQARDLDLLGIKNKDSLQYYLNTLDVAWSLYEIIGVALVDMYTWQWIYEHPQATADELKETVINNAKNIWNKYYAPVFGKKDETILAIYSHMINDPLYLPNYPIGHIISFQLEEYLKDKTFGKEIIRMYSLGKLTPQVWMQKAIGENISIDPLLNATKISINKIK
ncbi:MAG TPA: hypothetical protein PK081_09820 [Bacteroidales bacterium]|nr:hypothetical protein [Bacteroidales bacterium]